MLSIKQEGKSKEKQGWNINQRSEVNTKYTTESTSHKPGAGPGSTLLFGSGCSFVCLFVYFWLGFHFYFFEL